VLLLLSGFLLLAINRTVCTQSCLGFVDPVLTLHLRTSLYSRLDVAVQSPHESHAHQVLGYVNNVVVGSVATPGLYMHATPAPITLTLDGTFQGVDQVVMFVAPTRATQKVIVVDDIVIKWTDGRQCV
jgi:hypothetical protein